MKPIRLLSSTVLVIWLCAIKSSESTWTKWTPWTPCTKSCGTGQRTRRRTCTIPDVLKSATDCLGPIDEKFPCNTQLCPRWGPWLAWTPCDKTCGNGMRNRRRTCLFGTNCIGIDKETETCQLRPCIPAAWLPWQPFSACSKLCGGGVQIRRRICPPGGNCLGQPDETKDCNKAPCQQWSEWALWSSCTKSCGAGGVVTRTRNCVGGGGCPGLGRETKGCPGIVKPCPLITTLANSGALQPTELMNRLAEFFTNFLRNPLSVFELLGFPKLPQVPGLTNLFVNPPSLLNLLPQGPIRDALNALPATSQNALVRTAAVRSLRAVENDIEQGMTNGKKKK